jgi:RHS repeat-associated protein
VHETGSPDDCVKTGDYLSRRTAPDVPNPLESVTSLTFDYAYDASGNVTSATRTLAPAPAPSIAPTDARTYTYDALNRLTASTRSDGSAATFAYDPAGNRTSVATTAGRSSTDLKSQFNAANQLLSSTTAGPTGTTASTYAYDPNGNRTSQTEAGVSTWFAYQSDGRLTDVTRNGRSSTYAYDGLGRQTSTTESSSHGTSTSETVWNGTTPIQQSSPTGSTALITDALGELALQADLGDPSDPATADAAWSLLDRLGSTVAQSISGSLTQLSTFDDWGTQSFDTPGWSATANFTGERTDPGYNLNTYLSRTYDPTTGSWLSQDSWHGLLTQPQTAARYAYVTNTPTTLVDLNGNRPWDPAVSVQGKTNGNWNYHSVNQGRSTSPTASDHYAAVKQGLPSDYYYSSGGTERGSIGTAGECEQIGPCSRVESLAARHADLAHRIDDTNCRGAGRLKVCSTYPRWRYGYTYTHTIASGWTAEQVMDVFKNHPTDIFPFEVTGCERFVDGALCHLDATDADNGRGDVRISTTATSVTFTVTSNGYFDEPGATITFQTGVDDSGNIILQQIAHGVSRDLGTTIIAGNGGALSTWTAQAANLRAALEQFGVQPNG